MARIAHDLSGQGGIGVSVGVVGQHPRTEHRQRCVLISAIAVVACNGREAIRIAGVAQRVTVGVFLPSIWIIGTVILGVRDAVAVPVDATAKLRDEYVVGPRAGQLGLIRLSCTKSHRTPERSRDITVSQTVHCYAETLIAR